MSRKDKFVEITLNKAGYSTEQVGIVCCEHFSALRGAAFFDRYL